MRNRLLGLRHYTVIGSYNQNHDVGSLCTACTHCSKRFVTRRIEKGNDAARRFNMISADMLRNTACFTGRDFGATDVIEQRCLAVIDVTHHCHHGRPRQQLRIGVLGPFRQQRFRIIKLGCMRLVAHFFNQDHCSFLIQNLIDRDHLTEFHQMLDHLGCLHCHLVCEFGNRNGFWHMHFLDDGFGWCLEITFTVVMMRVTTALRTTSPAVTSASRRARTARLQTDATFLCRVILPCG